MAASPPPRASQPKVLLYHETNPELWGRVSKLLGDFAERCDRRGEGAKEPAATIASAFAKDVAPVRQAAARDSTISAVVRAARDMEEGRPYHGMFDPAVLFGKVFAFVARLAQRLPELFPEGLPMLDKYRAHQVFLTRRQCAALLAAEFFGALPDTEAQTQRGLCGDGLDLPSFTLDYVLDTQVTKVLCVCSFFWQLAHAEEAFLEEVVSFARRAEALPHEEFWKQLDRPLSAIRFVEHGTIEDSAGDLQADFANEYLGGGVLHGGNVQEEIRFSVSPECLVGMLFCEKMEVNEAIFIVGALQYSNYSGYGGSFRFAGMRTQAEPEKSADGRRRRGPHIVALDALMFPGNNQYETLYILRELAKAYISCLGDPCEGDGVRRRGFATGNWGCGAFGGDPQLKSLIQWLAASAADRELVYYPFRDPRVASLPDVIKALQGRGARCRDLYDILQGHQENEVFEKVLAAPRPSGHAPTAEPTS